jgi:hypothetical protein
LWFSDMASSPSAEVPLHEPVFQQFLHDVHHAYPTPSYVDAASYNVLPSTGVWQQPDGFLPQPELTEDTNQFMDTAVFPPQDLSEEEALMEDFRNIHKNLPKPRHHVAAPVPDSLPAPSKLSSHATAMPATPKKRSTRATPKAPAKRWKSRSVAPPPSPSNPPTWTNDEKDKLRELKLDQRSRFNWKTVAGKLGRSEADVKNMWKHIKDRLG